MKAKYRKLVKQILFLNKKGLKPKIIKEDLKLTNTKKLYHQFRFN